MTDDAVRAAPLRSRTMPIDERPPEPHVRVITTAGRGPGSRHLRQLVLLAVVVVVGAVAAVVAAGALGTGSHDVSEPVVVPSPEAAEPTSAPTRASDPLPEPTGAAEPEFVLPLGLPPGTCYTEVPGADDMSDLHEVECATPHLTELTTTVPLSVPFAESGIVALAEIEAACMHANHAFGTAPGEHATGPESYRHFIAWPHSSQWDDEGGRVAYCFYAARPGPTTGSLVDGTSELLPGRV